MNAEGTPILDEAISYLSNFPNDLPNFPRCNVRSAREEDGSLAWTETAFEDVDLDVESGEFLIEVYLCPGDCSALVGGGYWTLSKDGETLATIELSPRTCSNVCLHSDCLHITPGLLVELFKDSLHFETDILVGCSVVRRERYSDSEFAVLQALPRDCNSRMPMRIFFSENPVPFLEDSDDEEGDSEGDDDEGLYEEDDIGEHGIQLEGEVVQ
ncbi:hypothetical protein CC2G_006919 [Coprinopsis cinerea AmutBmut pab1-1]|nr:hypothetical protein CC2G_006919 [Coprinopsis cinerea AmutBmut pab1-1]